MRRFILIAAMVAFALGGAAACSNDEPTPSSTSQAATTAADQTKEVCAEAAAAGTAAAATIKAKANEAAAALSAGDQAKLIQITTDIKKAAAEWSAKLTELSNKPVDPKVKAALNDGITKINAIAAATTPPPDAEAQVNEFATKLSAACS